MPEEVDQLVHHPSPLLTFEDYQRLTGAQDSIIDLLSLPPGVEDAELETPRARDLAQPADLS